MLGGLNASSPVEETVLFGSEGLFCQLMSLSHQYVWDPELWTCWDFNANLQYYMFCASGHMVGFARFSVKGNTHRWKLSHNVGSGEWNF